MPSSAGPHGAVERGAARCRRARGPHGAVERGADIGRQVLITHDGRPPAAAGEREGAEGEAEHEAEHNATNGAELGGGGTGQGWAEQSERESYEFVRGPVRPGSARSGPARPGSVRPGPARLGSVRPGSPRRDRPAAHSTVKETVVSRVRLMTMTTTATMTRRSVEDKERPPTPRWTYARTEGRKDGRVG